MKKRWKASNIMESSYLGIIEFQDDKEEWHNFEVRQTADRLIFGGSCNTGFLESGYIEMEDGDVDDALQELLADLEVYYNDGPQYTSHIIFNERM